MRDQPSSQVRRQEPEQINTRFVVLTAAAIIAAVVVAGAVSTTWLDAEKGVRPEEPAGFRANRMSGQRARELLARIHDREERRLTTYAWSDAARSHARIPIDRAIDLMSLQGQSPGGGGGAP